MKECTFHPKTNQIKTFKIENLGYSTQRKTSASPSRYHSSIYNAKQPLKKDKSTEEVEYEK